MLKICMFLDDFASLDSKLRREQQLLKTKRKLEKRISQLESVKKQKVAELKQHIRYLYL